MMACGGRRSINCDANACSLTACGPYIGPHVGRKTSPLAKLCMTAIFMTGQWDWPSWFSAGG